MIDHDNYNRLVLITLSSPLLFPLFLPISLFLQSQLELKSSSLEQKSYSNHENLLLAQLKSDDLQTQLEMGQIERQQRESILELENNSLRGQVE